MSSSKPKSPRRQPNPIVVKAAEEVDAAKKNSHQLELFPVTGLHRKKAS